MIGFNELISPTGFDPMSYWVIALLGLPFISFVTAHWMGRKAPFWTTLLLLINVVLSVYLAINYWKGEAVMIRGDWFSLGTIQFNYSFLLDRLALIMLVVVNGISLLVHIFSMEYMRHDAAKPRYFAFLGLFTFSMLGIVLFYNLLLLFIFWELVGFSSFLLIGFWFEKKSASLAANKAFIVNRIGDLGFLMGLMILYAQFQSFDLEAIKVLMFNSEVDNGYWIVRYLRDGNEVVHMLDARWLSAAGIALFCGAVGKSAQFPLQIWLPDAMEGPTPVSALIHAATMVAAGVFMLARVFVLLDAQALEIIAIVGAVTALMAAVAALSQLDLKKILAYSTVSQLGYMVMAMGVGAYDAGFFHLITHAFFKAGLFLSAGIIIHQLHQIESDEVKFDVQDIRVMGGLKRWMPVTFFCFLLASLALAGFPGFSGFLSKDAILLGATVWGQLKGGGYYVVPVLAFITVFITSLYIFRAIFLVFFGSFRLPKMMGHTGTPPKIKEGNWQLTVPAILLAMLSLSLIFGFTMKMEETWLSHGINTPVFMVPEVYAAFNLADLSPEIFEKMHGWVVLLSIVLAVGGLVMAAILYRPSSGKVQAFHNVGEPKGFFGKISFNHWYLDAFYRNVLVKVFLLKSKWMAWFDKKVLDGIVEFIGKLQVVLAHIFGWFDRSIIDGFVHLVVFTSGRAGQLTRAIQTGNVQTYIVSAIALLLLLLLWLAF